jgi:hypothetical protein
MSLAGQLVGHGDARRLLSAAATDGLIADDHAALKQELLHAAITEGKR